MKLKIYMISYDQINIFIPNSFYRLEACYFGYVTNKKVFEKVCASFSHHLYSIS